MSKKLDRLIKERVEEDVEKTKPVEVTSAPPPSIELGDLVRDVTSGYEGIVIGIAAYLFGDSQVQLQRYVVNNTRYEDPLWFNGKQLKLLKKSYAQAVMG